MAKTTAQMERQKRTAGRYVELRSGERVPAETYEALSRTDRARLQELGVEGFQQDIAGRLAKEQAVYASRQADIAANYVQLSTGEYVAKVTFEALTSEQQERLLAVGAEQFTEGQEAERLAWEAAHVQLSDEEWVTREDFDALGPDQQAQLMELGVEGFNVASQEAQAVWEAAHVQLSSGEWVEKSEFDALSPDRQQRLTSLGVEGFNAVMEQERIEFEAKHTQLSTGDWVIKEDFDSLSPEDQSRLLQLGVEAFNTEQEKAYQDYQTKVESISKYKSEEGYDLVTMIQDGYTVMQLRQLGFDAADAFNAYQLVVALKDLEPYKLPSGNYDMITLSRDVRNGKFTPSGDSSSILLVFGREGSKLITYLDQDLELLEPYKVSGTDEYDLILLYRTMETNKDTYPLWAWLAYKAMERLFGEGTYVAVEEAYRSGAYQPYSPSVELGAMPGQLGTFQQAALPINLDEAAAREQFTALMATGEVPEGASFQSYDPVTGTATYSVEPSAETPTLTEADARSLFQVKIEEGEVRSDAVFRGIETTDGVQSIVYETPMSPREQFDSWKASDPSAPADAVYEGPSDEGGFLYSAASTMQVIVTTDKGDVTMLLSDWEKLPEIKQFELILDRPPTLNEWIGYCLTREGVNLPFSILGFPGLRELQAAVASFIPGEQKEEAWARVAQAAQREWNKTYPKMKWTGSLLALPLEKMGIAAAKAIYPQIKVTDITGKEWAATGLSVALWTMPVWLPKAFAGVRGVINKLYDITLTTRTPIIRFQKPVVRTDLGLFGVRTTVRPPVRVTWGAGLQRAGLSAQVEMLAFRAGSAATKLRAAIRIASKSKLQDTTVRLGTEGRLYPKITLAPRIASRLQTAQANSLSADTAFIRSLDGLRLSARQIRLLEKATGYKGLKPLIVNVSNAVNVLNAAWKTVNQTRRVYGAGSRSMVRALKSVDRARINLGKAVDALDDVLKPRYTEGAAPNQWRWDALIKGAEAELSRVTKAYNSVLNEFNRYKGVGARVPSKIRAALTENAVLQENARRTLESYIAGKKAGAQVPKVEGFGLEWTRGGGQITPEGPAAPGGGFGKGGTMSRELYEQLAQRAREAARQSQPWDPGYVPTGREPGVGAIGSPRGALVGLLESPGKLTMGQASLFGLEVHTVPVLSRLEFIPRYSPTSPLPTAATAIPMFSAEGALAGTLSAAMRLMPVLVPLTFGDVVKQLVLTEKQLSGKAKLTDTQVAVITKLLGVGAVKVRTIAVQGKLEQELQQQVAKLQQVTAGFTAAQVGKLASALETMQSRTSTSAEVQALAEALSVPKMETRLLLGTTIVPQEMTKLLEKTVAKPAERTRPATGLRTVTEIRPATKTRTATRTRLTTRAGVTTTTALGLKLRPTIVGPPPPELPEDKRAKKETAPAVPAGTYTWKQGIGWRSVPPPYTIRKPLFSFLPPVGAIKTSGKTPAETIQVIRSTGKEPKSISVDLGVTDIFIKGTKNPTIRFGGKGLQTDVGKRIPGPEKGLSLSGELELDDPVLSGAPTRAKITSKGRRRGRRRPLSDYEYMTTLKGYKP